MVQQTNNVCLTNSHEKCVLCVSTKWIFWLLLEAKTHMELVFMFIYHLYDCWLAGVLLQLWLGLIVAMSLTHPNGSPILIFWPLSMKNLCVGEMMAKNELRLFMRLFGLNKLRMLNTHLNCFGASNTNTTVLPILKWPSSSPLLRLVPSGNGRSAYSLL